MAADAPSRIREVGAAANCVDAYAGVGVTAHAAHIDRLLAQAEAEAEETRSAAEADWTTAAEERVLGFVDKATAYHLMHEASAQYLRILYTVLSIPVVAALYVCSMLSFWSSCETSLAFSSGCALLCAGGISTALLHLDLQTAVSAHRAAANGFQKLLLLAQAEVDVPRHRRKKCARVIKIIADEYVLLQGAAPTPTWLSQLMLLRKVSASASASHLNSYATPSSRERARARARARATDTAAEAEAEATDAATAATGLASSLSDSDAESRMMPVPQSAPFVLPEFLSPLKHAVAVNFFRAYRQSLSSGSAPGSFYAQSRSAGSSASGSMSGSATGSAPGSTSGSTSGSASMQASPASSASSSASEDANASSGQGSSDFVAVPMHALGVGFVGAQSLGLTPMHYAQVDNQSQQQAVQAMQTMQAQAIQKSEGSQGPRGHGQGPVHVHNQQANASKPPHAVKGFRSQSVPSPSLEASPPHVRLQHTLRLLQRAVHERASNTNASSRTVASLSHSKPPVFLQRADTTTGMNAGKAREVREMREATAGPHASLPLAAKATAMGTTYASASASASAPTASNNAQVAQVVVGTATTSGSKSGSDFSSARRSATHDAMCSAECAEHSACNGSDVPILTPTPIPTIAFTASPLDLSGDRHAIELQQASLVAKTLGDIL